jgi:RloB-like protein
MRPRRKSGKPLKRAVERRQEFKTVVVFCEGKKSEPDYINGVKKLPHVASNTALNIEVHPEQGAPMTLVKMAVDRQNDPEVDECWCLFDVEWPKNHPNLDAAVRMAKAAGVRLAISNPCFEVWLILHYRLHTRFEATVVCERESRGLDKRKGKSINADLYMPRRMDAARRASLLDERHAKNGNELPNNNPSSGMYHFLAAIEGEKKLTDLAK